MNSAQMGWLMRAKTIGGSRQESSSSFATAWSINDGMIRRFNSVFRGPSGQALESSGVDSNGSVEVDGAGSLKGRKTENAVPLPPGR